jgi:hypothetical protein
LKIIREHVSGAQAALVDFVDPQSGLGGSASINRLVDRLTHHLANDELVSALSVSNGEQKNRQAGPNSDLKAKDEVA